MSKSVVQWRKVEGIPEHPFQFGPFTVMDAEGAPAPGAGMCKTQRYQNHLVI